MCVCARALCVCVLKLYELAHVVFTHENERERGTLRKTHNLRVQKVDVPMPVTHEHDRNIASHSSDMHSVLLQRPRANLHQTLAHTSNQVIFRPGSGTSWRLDHHTRRSRRDSVPNQAGVWQLRQRV